MHLLPTNLAKLADHTNAMGTNKLTATCGVNLTLTPKGYIADATDCKSVIRVMGTYQGDGDEFQGLQALKDAAGDQKCGSIPSAAWRSAFTKGVKLTKKMRQPELRAVAVKIAPDRAILGSTDQEQESIEHTALMDGRFPPVSDVLEPAKTYMDRIQVDPVRLAQLLQTMAAIGATLNNDGLPVVTITTNGSKMMRLETGTESQHIVAGLTTMGYDTPKNKQDDQETESAEDDRDQRIRELEEKLAQAEAVRPLSDELAQLNSQLRAALGQVEDLEEERRELIDWNERLKRELRTIREARETVPNVVPPVVTGLSRRQRLALATKRPIRAALIDSEIMQ